jgi:hypothetical protein
LQFNKRSQLFISVRNETLSVAAMCVNDPDCSLFAIQGCDATPTPTGFTEIVRDSTADWFAKVRQRSIVTWSLHETEED